MCSINLTTTFYFKFYPTQELLGSLFGLSQPQANVWIHALIPVLNTALGQKQQLPARKATALIQVLDACPGLEFIIDGTERPSRDRTMRNAKNSTIVARKSAIQSRTS